MSPKRIPSFARSCSTRGPVMRYSLVSFSIWNMGKVFGHHNFKTALKNFKTASKTSRQLQDGFMSDFSTRKSTQILQKIFEWLLTVKVFPIDSFEINFVTHPWTHEINFTILFSQVDQILSSGVEEKYCILRQVDAGRFSLRSNLRTNKVKVYKGTSEKSIP